MKDKQYLNNAIAQLADEMDEFNCQTGSKRILIWESDFSSSEELQEYADAIAVSKGFTSVDLSLNFNNPGQVEIDVDLTA